MGKNNLLILGICTVLIVFSVLSFYVSAKHDAAISMSVYVKTESSGSTIIRDTMCYDEIDSTSTKQLDCMIQDVNQQNCCWAKEGCNTGAIPGVYKAQAFVSCGKGDTGGGGRQVPSGSPKLLFECLAETEECESDQECVKLPGATQGHCTQGNSQGDKFCRPSDPWCGDPYCDDSQLENCPGSTRRTDIKSCPDDPICKYYVCEGGCKTKKLQAGDYPATIDGQNYPNLEESWTCNYGDDCKHCDGNGSCVTSCIDRDGDGYGIQPDPLFHADCCPAGSKSIDCNDNNATTQFGGTGFYISPAMTSSPYCDCNINDGFGQGAPEGPINLALPISQDLCFDGIDNDCDGPNDPSNPLSRIDCKDLGCSPNNWTYPIRNRTCAGDCVDDYQTEADRDRGCCPSPSFCVIKGRCVATAQKDGEFPEVQYCSQGKWHGGDYHKSVCNLVVNDTNYPTNVPAYSHWNLTGNAGEGKCCGDDINEYFTQGLFGEYACCNKPNMKVLGGQCVETLTEKSTWDNLAKGYCLGEGDCLVNPNQQTFALGVGNATDMNNPLLNPVRCIRDGEFIGDRYCNSGEWTTRTALVASQLIDFMRSSNINSGSLYCDTYQNVLNYYTYSVAGSYAEDYLGMQGYSCTLGTRSIPCTNNVCVLRYKQGSTNNVVIGTSLNQPVNSQMYSILEVLDATKEGCDVQIGSEEFAYCGTGIWYNNKIRSVIFTKDSISLSNIFVGSWLNILKGLFGETISYTSQRAVGSYSFDFAQGTHNFNKIYLATENGKTISILTEETNGKKYMTAAYDGFSTDICTLLNQYKSANAQLTPLECSEYSGDKYVLTGGTSAGYYGILDDLGPKIKIQ
jgi:hypothetical protein